MEKYSKKDTFTFPHDRNAMADHKMIDLNEKLGCEGSGIFWILVEALSREPTYRLPLTSLPGTARHYNSTPEKFKAVVIGFNLFKHDKEYYWSEALIRRMADREDFHIDMTKLAYKKYKKDPPPEKLQNKARLLLAQYGGVASALPTLSNGGVSAIHKLSKDKLSKDKLSKEKKSKPLYEAAADYEDSNFLKYFNELRSKYQDLDYDTEFLKFKAYWNEGPEYLIRPGQAWLNWLDKARKMKNEDRGNHHNNQAPINYFEGITPIVSGPDEGVTNG